MSERLINNIRRDYPATQALTDAEIMAAYGPELRSLHEEGMSIDVHPDAIDWAKSNLSTFGLPPGPEGRRQILIDCICSGGTPEEIADMILGYFKLDPNVGSQR